MRLSRFTFFLLLALAACGGPPSAEEIYAQSGQAMQALSSFRAVGEVHQEGQGPPLQVEYDLEFPDRFRLSFQGVRDGQSFQASAIAIGDELYAMPPQAQDWFVVPRAERERFYYLDVSGIFNALLTQATNLTYVGEEEMAGVRTYHIQGSVGPEVMALFHPGEEPPASGGTLEAWVGVKDSLVYQTKFFQGEDSATLRVSRFNDAPVSAPSNPRPFAELQTLLQRTPSGAPTAGLPQTPEEMKAFIAAQPQATQTCLQEALGAAVFQELAAGARMPTFTEVYSAFRCLGGSGN